MAGERRVPELCGGAGGVSDFGEPGPGRRDGRLRALVDAHDRSGLRDRDFAGAGAADTHGIELGGAGGALCSVDDWAHGGVAACGESEDGGAAGADGVDSSDGGGQPLAGGIRQIASNFGFA